MLLFEQGLEGLLGPVLAFEELPVELRRLLAEPLERDQVFLGGPEGLDQIGGRDAGRGRRWAGAGARWAGRWPFAAGASSRSGRPGLGDGRVGRRVRASSWAAVPGSEWAGMPVGGAGAARAVAAVSGRSWRRRP